MTTERTRPRLGWALAALVATAGLAAGQDKDKDTKAGEGADKKPASIEVLVPEYTKELKIEGKTTSSTGEKRTFETPALEPGKTYQYKIEILIEPNNYTKITRKRDITFKAGEEVKVDLRAEDKQFPDAIVVRWVPTPNDIVDKMAELAKVTKDDVIYDPGCGDAVMLIRPVKNLGAKKGIGIDIDLKMVKIAQDKAKEEGVADKVEIRKGDILKLEDMKDISEATVVLVYIGDDLGRKLEPILRNNLKPGARIVSHRFSLGDWKPDKTVTVTGQDGDEYVLHLWIVPDKK